MKELNLLRTCAILHDIGKPECWAKQKPWSEHVYYTKELIAPYLGEELALMAARHHTTDEYPEDYRPKTDTERIIHIADVIASGADRPEKPLPGPPLPKPPLCLTHVISDGSKTRMGIDAARLAYTKREVGEKLAAVGKTISLEPAKIYTQIHTFLGRRESFLRFIPADTRTPVNDVSLWDHLKLTAALATCVWLDGGYRNNNLEKYSFALLSGDADRVSKFINASSRLPDLRAGSQIVEKATQSAAKAIDVKVGPECVIFAGGGGFLAVAPMTKSDAILYEAKENFEAVTGGELTITVNSFIVDGAKMKAHFGDVWKEAMFRIRMKKLSRPPLPSKTIEEGASICDVCGLRPGKHPTAKVLPYDATPRYETLCEVCYKRRIGKEGRGIELEEIADEQGLVAVIKADGDGLGRVLDGTRIEGFGKAITPSRLSTISWMIDEACKTKLRETVTKHGGECIYAGGDDVLAVLPGCKAFDCAMELASTFREEMANELTLSVGVVVFDKKFPIYVALEAVSQLIKNAKSQPEKASVDFEVVSATEIMPRDINSEKRRKLRDSRLSNKPYKWDKFLDLLKLSKFLSTGTIPSAQINMIVAAMRRGGHDGAQKYVKYQMGRGQILWKLGEELLEYLQTGFYLDAFTIYNAIYRKGEV